MPLPDITPQLPAQIRTVQAERIRKFLKHVDSKSSNQWTVTIYGSAAVALYLADTDEYEYAYTRDIDIGHMRPEEVDQSSFDNESVDPPLHFHPYDVQNWLVHPDWYDSTVDFTELLETVRLQVRLLHPLDLIITKLERAGSQDLEDGQLLFERYLKNTALPRKRVREAAKYYVLSRRSVNQITYSFAGIFQDSIDLSDLL